MPDLAGAVGRSRGEPAGYDLRRNDGALFYEPNQPACAPTPRQAENNCHGVAERTASIVFPPVGRHADRLAVAGGAHRRRPPGLAAPRRMAPGAIYRERYRLLY